MADDWLKNYVLARADADAGLSEQARLVVLAALGAPEDLAEVLGDAATSDELVESLTAVETNDAEPIGAYLRSITVQGFRGIGAQVTVPFHPGPGLVVVAGRNGSGKSTLAEGLELALTGTNSRWNDKAAVWSQSWRNLHHGDPARIRVSIAEEDSGVTTIGVDWPPGEDVGVDGFKAWVRRDGQKREDTTVLGWGGALEMYRPLLSYDELSGILEGRPSDFYDQLHKLLGLEQLTEAMTRLDAEVKQLKQPSAELKKARDAVRPVLEAHDDPRATTALAQLKKRRLDLDVVRPLITEGTVSSVPSAWARAKRLTTPPVEDVALTCDALRSAAENEREEAERADAGRGQCVVDVGRRFRSTADHHLETRCAGGASRVFGERTRQAGLVRVEPGRAPPRLRASAVRGGGAAARYSGAGGVRVIRL
jgi:energy-coupling factor transporter ATP-binding protein EcfA2